MKITLDLADAELYRAIKVEAARSDLTVREIVEAALRDWLERREGEEDRQAAADALAEYERDGGVAVEEFLSRAAAELRGTYGDEPGQGA